MFYLSRLLQFENQTSHINIYCSIFFQINDQISKFLFRYYDRRAIHEISRVILRHLFCSSFFPAFCFCFIHKSSNLTLQKGLLQGNAERTTSWFFLICHTRVQLKRIKWKKIYSVVSSFYTCPMWNPPKSFASFICELQFSLSFACFHIIIIQN